METQVNPAVWEISGHIVLKRRKDYDDASEECAWRLLAEVSLSEERFRDMKESIRVAADLQHEYIPVQQESGYESTLPPVTAHLPEDCLVLQ